MVKSIRDHSWIVGGVLMLASLVMNITVLVLLAKR